MAGDFVCDVFLCETCPRCVIAGGGIFYDGEGLDEAEGGADIVGKIERCELRKTDDFNEMGEDDYAEDDACIREDLSGIVGLELALLGFVAVATAHTAVQTVGTIDVKEHGDSRDDNKRNCWFYVAPDDADKSAEDFG